MFTDENTARAFLFETTAKKLMEQGLSEDDACRLSYLKSVYCQTRLTDTEREEYNRLTRKCKDYKETDEIK